MSSTYPTTPDYLTVGADEFEATVTVASLRYSATKMRRHAQRQLETYKRAAAQLDLMATLVENNPDDVLTGQAWLEAADLIIGGR